MVSTLGDQLSCSECPYKGEKAKNLGLHIALVHGKLDFFLKNKSLVQRKRKQYMSQPKKLNIGPRCPVCDLTFTKSQNREFFCFEAFTVFVAVGPKEFLALLLVHAVCKVI